MNVLVFDIETVPDTDFGRRLYGLQDLDDEGVGRVMSFKQRQARNTEFLPIVQHKIVAISAVLRTKNDLHLFSLGEVESSEKELVTRFFEGLQRYLPELVSWNGSGFDLPVLHYRALLYGINADRYWETGETDREFRYNNYLSRFHWRHLDLMDILAGFQLGGRASLDQVATLLGYPGKLGMSGEKVLSQYLAGDIPSIRNYCETDVLNTYLIYLRFQLMRGILSEAQLEEEISKVKVKLEQSEGVHLEEYLHAWQAIGYGS
ncbi:MAG: 3'-5' exonuclease [Rhodospirillaceae bacterium]|nr:3'-5' exonuclease [Rhodospirillaceae bacterium]